jgi:hypothetical protein
MLVPLQLPPGVYKNGTEYQSKGRWIDSNLVRWTDGTIQPIGGWTVLSDDQVQGKVRAIHAWNDNDGNSWLAAASPQKLYVYNIAGDQFDITPAGLTAGLDDSTIQTGYGSWLYGYGAYGTSRPELSTPTPATQWDIDNFGQIMVAMSPFDGKVYSWDIDTNSPASQIPGSPVDNKGVVVTNERFLFCLGADGVRNRVKWADRETLTDWAPLATNEAGDYDLQTNGQLMAGITVQGQTLLLTSTDAHVSNYIGPPYVYGFEKVGSACGIISKKAGCSTDSGAYWMGDGSFYMYAGGKVIEIPCDVSDYLFNDINRVQSSKVIAVHESKFSEIFWFYPGNDSAENNKYVVYNYQNQSWYVGTLSRTAGIESGVFRNTIMCDQNGVMYKHENGYNRDGLSAHVESGPIEIGSGDNIVHITGMIPDEKTQGDVKGLFTASFYPNGDEFTYGPFEMSNPTDLRISGRQIKIKLQSDNSGDWRVGVNRLNIKQGGKR